MKTYTTFFIGTTLLSALLATGCKKDKDETPAPTTPSGPTYSIPTSYNGFTNVDHTESTTIIGMMSELSSQIAVGTGSGSATTPTPLDANHLKELFNNTANQFTSNPAYNTSGFQIESNCTSGTQAQLESFIDTLVAVSNSGTAASPGVAGLGLSIDATPKRYLLTANGINYSQLLFKNLMCDLILYQITARVNDNTVDNTANVAGHNYTAMEHTWDVAFGYWSVPDSFPTLLTPVKYWGSYSNQINGGLSCNSVVMNAFLKGRAAISNHDMATKNAQAAIIVAEFDKMTAGGVVQELNEIQDALTAGDQVKVVSALSECRGFAMSMINNNNPGRIITNAQIATLVGYFPANHWNLTTTDLSNIRSYIAGVYGFTAAQLAAL